MNNKYLKFIGILFTFLMVLSFSSVNVFAVDPGCYEGTDIPDLGDFFDIKSKSYEETDNKVTYTYVCNSVNKLKRYEAILKKNGFSEASSNDGNYKNGEIFGNNDRILVTLKYDNGLVHLSYNKEAVTVKLYDTTGKIHDVYEDQVERKLSYGWSYDMPRKVLYNESGEKREFDIIDVNKMLTQGWYEHEVQTLYAVGKQKVFKKSEVASQLKVGWFEEPVKELYNKNGDTKVFKKSEIETQLKNGWYEEPVTLMYALDGRSKYVVKSQVEANKKVGWYNGKPVLAYSLDGRTKYIGLNDVGAEEKVGWYYGKPTKLCDPTGKVKYVGENRVSYYKSIGWKEEPKVLMYSRDGRSVSVSLADVEKYKKVGWYNGKPVLAYSLDGRTKYIGLNDVGAEEKVGWYYGKPIKVYDKYGVVKTIGENRLSYYKSIGYYSSRPYRTYYMNTYVPDYGTYADVECVDVTVNTDKIIYKYKCDDRYDVIEYADYISDFGYDYSSKSGDPYTSNWFSISMKNNDIIDEYYEEYKEANSKSISGVSSDDLMSNSEAIRANAIRRQFANLGSASSKYDLYISAKAKYSVVIQYKYGYLYVETGNLSQ